MSVRVGWETPGCWCYSWTSEYGQWTAWLGPYGQRPVLIAHERLER